MSKTNSHDTDSTWIFTTSDAGKNWKEELAIEGAQIANVSFASPDNGWATGRRFGKSAPEEDSDLILHTVNGGRTWVDLSANLPIPGKGVDELYAVRPNGVSLFTLNGKIFDTVDMGQTWRQLGTFRDEYDQTAVQRVSSTSSNGIWLLGGAASVEGTWSLFAQGSPHGDWIGYRLAGVYLRDAAYLSENSILACGFINSTDRVSSGAKREGVILYSTDKGQSWITTYRDSGTTSINSITGSSLGNVWAVGEGGLVLRLRELGIAPVAAPTKPK